MTRPCSHILTTVLIEADDLAAAERVCAAGLARARDTGDLWSLGILLEKMAVLDLNAGRHDAAAAHLREGLSTTVRTGARASALDDLDCCGYLCAMTGRPAEAVTVWAAVVALQGHEGLRVPAHPDLPRGWFERQAPLREARRALGPARARAAEARGAAMSLATAAEYALLLTAADLPLAGEPGGTPAGEPGGTLGGEPGGTPAGAPGGTPAGAPGGTLGGAPGGTLGGRRRAERLPGSRAERWAGRRRRPGSAPGNGSWSSWSPGGRPTRRSPPSCSSACARSAPTWTASATRPAAGGAPTSPAWPSPPAWCSRPHP